ncbi:MAG: molybdopterin-dependent oxidoreductase [Planctomycetia bacterium]
MATVTINGRAVELGDQERLNVIQAAQRADVEIPHYCWHPSLSVVASCRMCLVEVGETKPDGAVAMQPKVVPGCQTPVKDGMVVVTDSEKVKASQAGTLEYLLLNHPLDCPICDQAGECFLQDYSYRFGRSESRLQEPKVQHVDKHHIGEQIVLFTDRCVMCSRCVRFTREISGTSELQVVNRGNHSEIDVFPGHPCDNKLAGNVVDICPVGALCSKDFLYKQRVWWLKSQNSVCPNCSTGCSIRVDQNENVVYRLKPRNNPQAQGPFMCDEGRYGFKYVKSESRLKQPTKKTAAGRTPIAWKQAVDEVKRELTTVFAGHAMASAVVLSPWMTVEEAYLLAKMTKAIAPEVHLVLGPVPSVGDDDVYPKGVDGEPRGEAKFTIRAEKCPNLKGVDAVLTFFDDEYMVFDEFLEAVDAGRIRNAVTVGGYRDAWLSADETAVLAKLDLWVLVDTLDSPAAAHANYVLPGAAFVEKDGTYVNHAGLAQMIKAAVRPPEQARPEGRIFMDLMGRAGLLQAATLRKEMAHAVPALAALAVGDLGELGVFLEPAEEPAVV